VVYNGSLHYITIYIENSLRVGYFDQI